MIRAATDRPLPLAQHLAELRRVLIVSSASWVVGAAAALALNHSVLGFLLGPLRTVLGQSNSILHTAIITSPTEGFTVPLKVAAITGLVAALPVVLWQVWGFVAPGLTPREQRLAGPLLASTVLLFVAGSAFAYTVMPIGLHFLATFLGGNATYFPDLDAYLSFFAILIVVFGITFELPVAVVLLGMARIVSSATLRKRRREIWIAIIAVSLIVTPGADPFTPTLLLVPLIALFEISVLVLAKVLHR
jgi:sec-independent protein translocase protein TatC